MRQHKGFSLIELLLVITIIGILSSVSYVGFLQFGRKQELDIAVDTLKNDLNVVKSGASSQVRRSSNCKSDSYTYIGAQITFNSDNYNLEEVCSNNGTTLTGLIKRVDLSSNIKILNTSPPFKVRFLALSRGITVAQTVQLKNTKTNKITSVSIDATGVIK